MVWVGLTSSNRCKCARLNIAITLVFLLLLFVWSTRSRPRILLSLRLLIMMVLGRRSWLSESLLWWGCHLLLGHALGRWLVSWLSKTWRSTATSRWSSTAPWLTLEHARIEVLLLRSSICSISLLWHRHGHWSRYKRLGTRSTHSLEWIWITIFVHILLFEWSTNF